MKHLPTFFLVFGIIFALVSLFSGHPQVVMASGLTGGVFITLGLRLLWLARKEKRMYRRIHKRLANANLD